MCIYMIYRNNNNSDNKLSLNIVLKWNCLSYLGDKTIRFYLYLCPYCPVQDTICKAFDWHLFIKCMNWIGVHVGGTNICACVHAHVCMQAHMACVETGCHCWASSLVSTSFFWHRASHWTWSSLIWRDLPSRKPLELFFPCWPSIGITGVCCHARFFTCVVGIRAHVLGSAKQ